MNDQLLPDIELQELRLRWEVAPTPKLALQLAEEYRRRNRHQQGIEVLEATVRSRPSYLAPRVALGRFYLELEQTDEATRVLEGVVEEDPTHLVASKLLVNLYLDTGEQKKARDRLDLYRLLNESGPEIEVLEQRFRGETEVAEAPEVTAPAEAAEAASPTPEPAAPEAEPLEAWEVVAAEPTPAERPEEPTTTAAPGAPSAETPAAEEPFPLPSTEPVVPDLANLEPPPPQLEVHPEASAAASAEAASEEVFVAALEGDPFEGIWEGVGDRRYWSLLGAEGIFPLPEAAAEGAPVEAIPAELPAAEPATATLADLYLEQGHLAEAEQAFREVLASDPENALARQRLAEIDRRRSAGLMAAELLAEVDPALGPRERKIHLLKSYLGRIRASAEGSEA